MHIAHPPSGLVLSTGIVGSGLPIAVGVGLAAQLRGTDQVTVASFGDGATGTGSFHEAVNLAALWRLPVVFVCQNNRYAEMTPTAHAQPVAHVADRAGGYGIPGVRVDGNDPDAVHAALDDGRRPGPGRVAGPPSSSAPPTGSSATTSATPCATSRPRSSRRPGRPSRWPATAPAWWTTGVLDEAGAGGHREPGRRRGGGGLHRRAGRRPARRRRRPSTDVYADGRAERRHDGAPAPGRRADHRPEHAGGAQPGAGPRPWPPTPTVLLLGRTWPTRAAASPR